MSEPSQHIQHTTQKEPTHLVVRLNQHLIIFTYGDSKHDGRNIFKTVDPLPTL